MSIHRAFGLNFRSFLPLPELPLAAGESADVEIVKGHVPEALADAEEIGVRFQAARGRLSLRVDGIARYLVEGGQRITVHLEAGAEEDSVRLFLLGSAFGAVLHQRGDLVLHASAIVTGRGVVGFLGRSGIGKSTLAMEFRRRGYRVLTDDLCVIRPDAAGVFCAQPGIPQSKLWLDSLASLELSAEGLRRIRGGLEKRALPLEKGFAAEAAPLRRLYLLQTRPENEIALEAVEKASKFTLLCRQTYRFRFVGGMGGRPGHLALAAGAARQASVAIVRRPAHAFRLEELADRIEADW